jgi:hypothetical protein
VKTGFQDLLSGFNPCAYEVKSWFPKFADTCNVYRYVSAQMTCNGGENVALRRAIAAAAEVAISTVVGLYKWNRVDT